MRSGLVKSTTRGAVSTPPVPAVAPNPLSCVDVDVTAVLHRLRIEFQPIIDLATGAPFAMEALARFGHAPAMHVEDVFAAAHEAGYGYLLEAACLREALHRRALLPDGVRITVNVSPDVLLHPVLGRAWPNDLDGVIIEVTEHRATRPQELLEELARLRGHGATIAVDDVGTGYAGLLRLATLRPDFVKIDRSVVAGVRTNAAQAAVLEALVNFSHRMGASVVGEGIEELADIPTLVDFDVDLGQGWAIAKAAVAPPAIPAGVATACQQARTELLRRRPVQVEGQPPADAMDTIMSSLVGAASIADLHDASALAARQLGVDCIGVSVLGVDGELREITSAGAAIDTERYAIVDYPATETVLKTGNAVEVHVSDPDADPAEVEVLSRIGIASLLMLPLTVAERPVGVLEINSGAHRRWTAGEVSHARRLAANIGQALARLNGPRAIHSPSTAFA